MSRREDLVAALAKIQAHRKGLAAMKDQVHKRADEQGDALGGALRASEDHQEAGMGGILVHRMTRTLLTDRARLERIRGGG